MTGFIDTHCHIQSVGLKSNDNTNKLWAKTDLAPDDIIQRAINENVVEFICVGCDIKDSNLVTDFISKRENCYGAVGIHPHEAKRYPKLDQIAAKLEELVSHKKVVAIGECGLDYFYNHSNPEQQKNILRIQLDLAVKYQLPIIFHVREAFSDFWPIFDQYGGKIQGVLHSFTDSERTLAAALERGLYIGVNGIATFAKEPAQQAMFKAIPIEKMLLETDAPYLTPVPYRGNINEPKHIATVAQFLANYRGEETETIMEQTYNNAHLLFMLK